MRSAEAPKTERPEQARPGVNSDLLRGVRVALDARLGKASLSIEDVMALKPGSVVTLQKGLAESIELYLNDNLVARGEIVAVGDKYGVRIVEIANAP
jgi:flagellar motor switch protein FliN/FliY